jgi:single-strand DNA-binding protein
MASRSVNKVILIGHLGKDAETKFTPSGASVTKMTLATSRRWKDKQTGDWKEETEWHNITAWSIDNLAQYLLKGKQIYVEGRLQTRSYEDKDGQKKYFTDVVTDDIVLLSGGGGGRGEGGSQGADDMEQGSGYNSAPRASGPVSMPRSAQQRSAPPQQQAPRSSGPSSTPFEPEITDDDVPF